jgi:pimeloyl-ACP methyl ester carboxylesterase
MRWLKKILLVIVVLIFVYLVGPNPSTPVYDPSLPKVPSLSELDRYISINESKHKIRPDNEARIVWANDSAKQKTAYSIVYLHGFSASQGEGDPVHQDIAKRFGCNLYLSRLSEHGIDTSEQLLNLTPEGYWESAKEALAIGKQLGEKVILMGTSTGGTQALQLAAAFPNDIAGLLLYSPNIAINDGNAWLLNNPWGLQIAKLVKGGKYNDPSDQRPIYKQYWNKPYRLEAVVALQEMLETTMTPETFAKVKQPLLMLYYYKDEEHQDKVVKVSAMKKMYEEVSTPPALKREKALPKTGDHVIGSPIKSGDVQSVELETTLFMEDILHLKPVH